MNLIDILTRLDGRIGRLRFWLGIVVLFAGAVAISVAIAAAFGAGAFAGPFSGSSAFGVAFGMLVFLASVPLTLKRLHDLNWSIRWLWPLIAFEILRAAGDLSGVTGTAAGPNKIGLFLALTYTLYAIVLAIPVGFVRGTRGPNDFGPDPLAPEEIPARVDL